MMLEPVRLKEPIEIRISKPQKIKPKQLQTDRDRGYCSGKTIQRLFNEEELFLCRIPLGSVANVAKRGLLCVGFTDDEAFIIVQNLDESFLMEF